MTERSLLRRLATGRALPLATVLLLLTGVWYAGAVWLNRPQVVERLQEANPDWRFADLLRAAWSMERPVLPAPHQVASELYATVIQKPVTSRRSLVYHAYVTASAAAVGFVLGTLLGILLAVGIVNVHTLDRSLLPWIIASQTIPILAIAPMIVVVLGNLGFTGLFPKAVISMYLCFFPVTIGMVKGLRSPEVIQLELLQTYSALPSQVFWKLRWPASMPYLFASLKVAIASSLVGAIVGELPAATQEGLGARLLSGSYYGQTLQIWSALVMASVLGMLLVFAVGAIERLVLRRAGAKP